MTTSMDESEDDDEMCLYPPGEICRYALFCKARREENIGFHSAHL